MSRTRLFRNDGAEMFADDPDRLEYVDPGIVLLYADTGRDLVCSYVEGRLGQPIQATLEHEFDDGLDLTALDGALDSLDAGSFERSPAPRDDRSSPRWAFDGLSEDPLRFGTAETDAIRRLLAGTASGAKRWRFGRRPRRRDQATPTLDFAVASVYDGARLFRFLVEALAAADVTVALSKSGRIGTLAETDVVVHVAPDEVPSDCRACPIEGTGDLVDAERERAVAERFRARLDDPIADLTEALADGVRDVDGLSEERARAVLRERLDGWLGEQTGDDVVDPTRRRALLAGVAASGLLAGFGLGVVASDAVRRSAAAARRRLRSVGAATLDRARASVGAPSIGTEQVLIGGVAVAAALLLVATVLVRRRRGGDRPDVAIGSARSDAITLGLNVAAAASLVALLVSVALLVAG
ncbi:hypothetical protein [Halomicrobium salinisoli]|uniref:hypothetical protein n=1 Tax=Halomicrobium salinisoli TaxID=2878391 RepID=UPI001CF033E6|nr:hypothetical protein [Halomicrobium salinisoli]